MILMSPFTVSTSAPLRSKILSEYDKPIYEVLNCLILRSTDKNPQFDTIITNLKKKIIAK